MTTFSLLAKKDQAVTRLHVHGLDEASQQLAPFLPVHYVQLQRGGACFHGAATRLGNTFVGCAGANRDKVEFIEVPAGRTLIVAPAFGLARLGTTCVTVGDAMVAHGPSQLIAYSDREYRMSFASMPDCWTGRIVNPTSGGLLTVLRLSETESRMFHRYVHGALQQEGSGGTSFSRVSTLRPLDTVLMNWCDSWLADLASRTPNAGVSTARCNAAIRARQFIDEHLEQSLTLASVCHASYSSARALEYGFQEIFGVSPITYIRCARLSRVRRELCRSTQIHGRVTQLAIKWGFWHLSQFSSDYYELFGELPSTTLGRATGRLDRPASIDCDYVQTMTPDRARAQV